MLNDQETFLKRTVRLLTCGSLRRKEKRVKTLKFKVNFAVYTYFHRTEGVELICNSRGLYFSLKERFKRLLNGRSILSTSNPWVSSVIELMNNFSRGLSTTVWRKGSSKSKEKLDEEELVEGTWLRTEISQVMLPLTFATPFLRRGCRVVLHLLVPLASQRESSLFVEALGSDPAPAISFSLSFQHERPATCRVPRLNNASVTWSIVQARRR